MRTTNTEKTKLLVLDYVFTSTQRLKRIEKLIFVGRLTKTNFRSRKTKTYVRTNDHWRHSERCQSTITQCNTAAAAAKLLQLSLTLCNSMDPRGSSVHGIFQARILEVDCHFLLQGIFLPQGLNPYLLCLLHWLLPLSRFSRVRLCVTP